MTGAFGQEARGADRHFDLRGDQVETMPAELGNYPSKMPSISSFTGRMPFLQVSFVLE